MKKTIVLTATFLTIGLSPLTVLAQQDSQYPAANFQPKVIFIDEALAKNAKATNNQSSQSDHKKAEFDPQHPAAFFEPKVIFP